MVTIENERRVLGWSCFARTALTLFVLGSVALSCLETQAGPPTRPPRPSGKAAREMQARREGKGGHTFAMFVTLAGVLAATYAVGRWLTRLRPAWPAGWVGASAGAVIGLVAAAIFLSFSGLADRGVDQTIYAVGLCLLFGIYYGQHAARQFRDQAQRQ